MTGVEVRAARVEDYDAIARLTVAAYEADGQVGGDHGGEHGYDRVLADVAGRAEHGDVLVAVDPAGGDVLGSVTFVRPGTRYAELSRDGEAEFRMLAVHPAAQGRGVGEALTRACVDRAGELGCTAVVISARSFAAPAHRLYGRLGFVRVPELDWSPAPGIDLIGLRLELRPGQ